MEIPIRIYCSHCMPTIITHAVAGAAIAPALAPCGRRSEFTWIAAACAVLPDADVLGFSVGIAYDSMFAHRGFTRSPSLPDGSRGGDGRVSEQSPGSQSCSNLRLHFCGDGFTRHSGRVHKRRTGRGILPALDPTRYFFPAPLILVSPIGLNGFLGQRAQARPKEMQRVRPPSICVFLAARLTRCRG